MAKNKREHGQGTIYLRKDGRWYGAVQNGYNENGKPKMVTVYGKTEAEVKRKLKEKIMLINSNGLSYSSIKKAYEAINECCKYAIVRDDLQKNPCIGVKTLTL